MRILELLRAAPGGLEVTELAQRSGLHPNTVRVHLATLTEAGLTEGVTVRGGGRGRPSIRHHATEPAEDGYRLLSSMLASALSTGDPDGPSPVAEAAGRRWGRQLAERRDRADGSGPADLDRGAPASVNALFDRLGFAPERDEDRIVLHACPFRDLAVRHPDVVCGLHLGLLRGALDASGARGGDAWLQPFDTPTRCVAGLTAAPPA